MNSEFDKLRFNLYTDIALKHRPTVGAVARRFSKKIPIILTGGVGDVIIARPLVQKINKLCGPVEVYTKHVDVFKMLDPSGITVHHGNTFKPIDFWITINSIVKFNFGTNFSGFKSDELTKIYLNYRVASKEWYKEIHYHPYLDNLMAKKAISMGLNRTSLPWHLMGLEQEWMPTVQFDKGTRKYITVHQGFETNQHHIRSRSTKNWSREQWSGFVTAFKKKHPDVLIIQLGAVTGHDIKGVDINYRNRLSMQDSFHILGRSLCHVDGDSGLVHAAHAFGVKSVVMFGSTPRDFFGYKENINIMSDGCPEEGACWWLKDSWLKTCVLGKTTPLCMDQIEYSQVLDAVSFVLREKEQSVTLSHLGESSDRNKPTEEQT